MKGAPVPYVPRYSDGTMSSSSPYLPSIWIADFASKDESDTGFSKLSDQFDVIASMDDSVNISVRSQGLVFGVR